MTDDELADAFGELRTICTNIIGFHILTEREDEDILHPAHRVMYEAQVYANGLALAYSVHRIADELTRRRDE
ncbi:hypothetical protein [Methylobacterium oryzisoli]|uniref:hypothetical protein n=1 Tax=Methylobacterium oryzisoli TaxID=3385502 RepID=UPI0038923A63